MGTWPTCITTFFFSSLCATEEASVQDQDSTTGRIALIITPKSDSNAHLINISIIIGLIILLQARDSWEEPTSVGFHVTFHVGLERSALNHCSGFTHVNYVWNRWFLVKHEAKVRPSRLAGVATRVAEAFLHPHQSFRVCPSDATDRGI